MQRKNGSQSGSDYDSYDDGSLASEQQNVYGRKGPEWNSRKRMDDFSDSQGSDAHDFDKMKRFGQRKSIGDLFGGHKSPSIASLISSNTSFDEHEDGLKWGMKETAGGEQAFRMTVIHSKILVLVSKYGQIALSESEPETWIRELPLLVLVYEGITAGACKFCRILPSA